jgi:glutathione S-transferase
VKLYTCPFEKHGAGMGHPCGRAAKALDEAGHNYEIEKVKGGIGMIWTWPTRARDRAEIERLSGQRSVPILVLDNGGVVTGSGEIAKWAAENPATKAAGSST